MPELNPDTAAGLSRSNKAGALGAVAGLFTGPTIMTIWNLLRPSAPIDAQTAASISAVASCALGVIASFVTPDHLPVAVAAPVVPTAPGDAAAAVLAASIAGPAAAPVAAASVGQPTGQ